MNEIAETKITKLEELEHSIIRECGIQAKSIAETGKHLKAINDGEEYRQRGYSSFAEYMKDACGEIFPFSASQAYKYIRIWESFGSRLEQYSGIALDILDMFKYETPEDFAELAEKHDLEHMSVKEAAELKKQLEKATEQISFLTKEKEAVTKELDELCSKPVDVAVSEVSEEDKEKIAKEIEEKFRSENAGLSDKLKKAEKEAKDLKKQLADKDRTAEEQRKNIADGYEKKLKALDEKLNSEKSAADERVKKLEKELAASSGKADEQLIEFKFYFEQAQAYIKKFIPLLENIPDEEKRKKFKGAALKFIEAVKSDVEKIGENNE